MAPTTPGNKKTILHRNVQNGATAVSSSSPSINYSEAQAEEVEALQAIYMEDFQEVEVKSAWSKPTDRSFKIKLRSTADASDEDDAVTLGVRLTATYPKTAPLLTVEGSGKFHERTRKNIDNIIETRPKHLLGDVMIHDICSEIQQVLDDAVTARAQGVLPSLEDERASAEEAALVLQKQSEEAEARRAQEAQAEESHRLSNMVSQELNRLDKQKPSKSATAVARHQSPRDMPDSVTFEQTAKIRIDGQDDCFTRVAIYGLLSTNRLGRTYLGKPETSRGASSPLVAVLRRKMEIPRHEIYVLESALATSHEIRHANLVNVLTYRVDSANAQLFLCREYADRGSLHDYLALSDLHISKSRQFTIQLLEGLDCLHQHGLAHGSISTKTICFSSDAAMAPKLADFGYAPIMGLSNDDIPLRWTCPDAISTSHISQRNKDIWDLGIVVFQMFMGFDATSRYSSPSTLAGKHELSNSFRSFLEQFFTTNAKKRSSCFDLLSAEFLRSDIAVMNDTPLMDSANHRSRKSSSGLSAPFRLQARRDSTAEMSSRYANEFVEEGRLGKGGFGEVVLARNRIDHGRFAVKKIKQAVKPLDNILGEVKLLVKLNHPYVVRYYMAWEEKGLVPVDEEDDSSATDDTSSKSLRADLGYVSTGGLDFVSSHGARALDTEDEDDLDYSGEDDIFERDTADAEGSTSIGSNSGPGPGSLQTTKAQACQPRMRSILYIVMELCDRRSLRDMIFSGMTEDESWRFVRQITEGLAHIHGHGIIHRDLKPDNVFIDSAGNPKIGDFGLARPGRYNIPDKQNGSSSQSFNATRSIGTALYVAPELQSASRVEYTTKVDIYSLGIVFFEMCQTFGTGMERVQELQKIRQKDHSLPPTFQPTGDKAAQGRLVNWLISHDPSARPTSAELLRSESLPIKVEDEVIRVALAGVSDRDSPYHQQIMGALFSPNTMTTVQQDVTTRVWQSRLNDISETASAVRLKGVVLSSIRKVFAKHGAQESRRDGILPRSGANTNANVYNLLDSSGNLVQLPYDFTVPYAMQLAREPAQLKCTFAIGAIYRDISGGGPPHVNDEADFDIVNIGQDGDIAMNDAEVIKVMDEVLAAVPDSEPSGQFCFQLNHGSLLDAILDYCRVPQAQQTVVKETLSKVGEQHVTLKTLRPDLRNLGISDTMLDDLEEFDWREDSNKAWQRLHSVLDRTAPRISAKASAALSHLQQVVRFVECFGVSQRLVIAPLRCVNAKLYDHGMLFQCLVERKKKSLVLAAGGRYDHLIESFRNANVNLPRQGAVGLSIAVDRVVKVMGKASSPRSKNASQKTRNRDHKITPRCEVLVSATGSDKLVEAAIKLLSSLWQHDISAELSTDHGSVPATQAFTFVVTLRHETSSNVRVKNTLDDGDEVEVPVTSLVSYLQQELRDRMAPKARPLPTLLRNSSSHHDGERQVDNVQVLVARQGSKKTNRSDIVQRAKQRWSQKLDQLKDAPILAIETRDEVLNLIQNTRLGDAESWKKAIQAPAIQPNERQYIGQVQEALEAWRSVWQRGDGARIVSVCNFRSGMTIPYDLGF